MIAYLKGTVLQAWSDAIILLQGNIGYKIFVADALPYKQGEEVKLYIHHHSSQDGSSQLLGFPTFAALELFEKIIKVSGVGPKLAIKIMYADTPSNISKAIAEGNVDFFVKIKGLGKKNAQKIILELRNKLVEPSENISRNPVLYSALESLQFTKKEIDAAIKTVNISSLSDEQAIEAVLKVIGK